MDLAAPMVGSLKMAVSVAQVQRPWAFLSAGSEAKNTTSEAWKYNVLCSCGYATAVLPSCLFSDDCVFTWVPGGYKNRLINLWRDGGQLKTTVD